MLGERSKFLIGWMDGQVNRQTDKGTDSSKNTNKQGGREGISTKGTTICFMAFIVSHQYIFLTARFFIIFLKDATTSGSSQKLVTVSLVMGGEHRFTVNPISTVTWKKKM